MDFTEWVRRLKRSTDNYFNLTYRRTFFLILLLCAFILYMSPYFTRRFKSSKVENIVGETCLKNRLHTFDSDLEQLNANVLHMPKRPEDKDYLPWVGNGVFGIAISDIDGGPEFHIRQGRVLSMSVPFQPLITILSDNSDHSWTEAIVTHYPTGIVHRLQCSDTGLHAETQFYAHRTLSSIFVQELKITNPNDRVVYLNTRQRGVMHWSTAVTHQMTIIKKTHLTFAITTGLVEFENNAGGVGDFVSAVTVVSQIVPETIEIKPRKTFTLTVLTCINYSEPIRQNEYGRQKETVEKQAIENMRQGLNIFSSAAPPPKTSFKNQHVAVWQNLWSTGISISESKASDAVNGDHINATIYLVLSHCRSLNFESGVTQLQKAEVEKLLLYSEGCFGGHHTLQAQNLWTNLRNLDDVNSAVSLWLLTLEKQGCHNLIKAGASGIMQAMILSLAGLRFSNQHLELNIHPKFLHRDFQFRRINYGNATHLNVSVVLGEDNKAVLYASLDRSDKDYYACDAGCLDTPVQLGQDKKSFPVKLTDPLTPILYITYDKLHMEELRHTIHVKEIVEAPAHDHHVIALHRHGHHLGGLPTLFWVSISFLIIVFHLFLIKLIYNEFRGQNDKYRPRYSKL